MKNKVNILFVCGYGVGSSLMLKTVVGKALKEYNIENDMKHTAAGEASGYMEWADIVAVSKKLVDMISVGQNKYLIEIENLMDGATIGKQINEIVVAHFPDAINN